MDELKEKGVLTLSFGDDKAELAEEDLLIDMTQTPGYATESAGDVTVVLDGNLTPELIDEGYVNEIISKVQTMRKEAGFEVMDHIVLYHKDNAEISRIMETYTQEVAGDVLADEVIAGEPEGYVKEWDINGQKVTLGVKKK